MVGGIKAAETSPSWPETCGRVSSRGRGARQGPELGAAFRGGLASPRGRHEREAEGGVPETGRPHAAGGEDGGAAGQERAGAGSP